MWHSKIVPHFAVVFKDRSHVLAFTKSMHIFSVLQGSEGLNCPTSLEHPLEWEKIIGTSCFHFEPCFTGELQGKQIAEL